MARTRKWDVRTDGRTYVRTGRTGVTLNAFRYFSNTRGHNNCLKKVLKGHNILLLGQAGTENICYNRMCQAVE